ncbi:TetR family transcriptional regulator [Streptomyces sp. NPDC051018]|uniref:TetR family transcriptional regulator n=1 Tax=Streptomyces sp. NPDC051018 TaxID=3365639 RepID=UPI0037BB3B9D
MTISGTAPDRARRPKGRRVIIETAAAELFADRGYAATGVGDIADRVGVTSGAIYRHFAGKEDLLQSILQSCLDDFRAKAVPAPGSSPREAMQEVVASAVGLTLSRPDRVATYLREWRWLTDAASARIRIGERELTGQWETVMRAVVPDISRWEAVQRQRAVNGSLMMLARRSGAAPHQRLQALFTDAILAMVTAPAARIPAARPKPQPRTWRSPRPRRQEIRDAASLLFRRYGYHGVGMDQIGKAVGISGPTVYGTYDSKAEILVDVCDYAVGKTEAAVEQALEAADSAQEALRLVTRAYAMVALDDTDLTAVAGRETEELPDGDRTRLRHRRAGVHFVCVAVLGEVRPELDEAEARVLFSAARTAVQATVVKQRGGRASTDGVADLMLRFLLGRQGSDAISKG